jgi:glycine/serine hydroxymethyltransferase
MRRIAAAMARAIRHAGDETVLADVRREVRELTARFPIP